MPPASCLAKPPPPQARHNESQGFPDTVLLSLFLLLVAYCNECAQLTHTHTHTHTHSAHKLMRLGVNSCIIDGYLMTDPRQVGTSLWQAEMTAEE